MKVTQAELVTSAVSSKQYPQEALPEIALAGRSNVGKSSFINKLINRKNLARTSSKPGKTQTLNFYRINGQFFFVDLPGYGYAKVSKTERERWGRFIEEYLTTRQQLQLICHLVDIRHKPTRDDQMMADWLQAMALPRLVIATKADKISKGKIAKHLKIVKETLQLAKDVPLIAFSAETGLGKEEVWAALKPYIDHKVPTTLENKSDSPPRGLA
ncbi:putative GTP-binding protein EngB [Caldalkalibacillus thermarum]|uniref:ribosome biogenesis GTP-binding protein YihA/YsxC n=1 Tax=Caldalkalibacillus thermarum TaxID=296745 RepID=UPI00166CBC93|nr:ribosome biogenesis GTP-binding protein YihA/YsxC [Caldalkalibacillus thermarum]GGK15807.1 putative GTP-binding protein EngB [Caldalkalibacillus thermarum]